MLYLEISLRKLQVYFISLSYVYSINRSLVANIHMREKKRKKLGLDRVTTLKSQVEVYTIPSSGPKRGSGHRRNSVVWPETCTEND